MEELNQIASQHLCREDTLFPTILGSVMAATVACVLAVCLGYF